MEFGVERVAGLLEKRLDHRVEVFLTIDDAVVDHSASAVAAGDVDHGHIHFADASEARRRHRSPFVAGKVFGAVGIMEPARITIEELGDSE